MQMICTAARLVRVQFNAQTELAQGDVMGPACGARGGSKSPTWVRTMVRLCSGHSGISSSSCARHWSDGGLGECTVGLLCRHGASHDSLQQACCHDVKQLQDVTMQQQQQQQQHHHAMPHQATRLRHTGSESAGEADALAWLRARSSGYGAAAGAAEGLPGLAAAAGLTERLPTAAAALGAGPAACSRCTSRQTRFAPQAGGAGPREPCHTDSVAMSRKGCPAGRCCKLAAPSAHMNAAICALLAGRVARPHGSQAVARRCRPRCCCRRCCQTHLGGSRRRWAGAGRPRSDPLGPACRGARSTLDPAPGRWRGVEPTLHSTVSGSAAVPGRGRHGQQRLRRHSKPCMLCPHVCSQRALPHRQRITSSGTGCIREASCRHESKAPSELREEWGPGLPCTAALAAARGAV